MRKLIIYPDPSRYNILRPFRDPGPAEVSPLSGQSKVWTPIHPVTGWLSLSPHHVPACPWGCVTASCLIKLRGNRAYPVRSYTTTRWVRICLSSGQFDWLRKVKQDYLDHWHIPRHQRNPGVSVLVSLVRFHEVYQQFTYVIHTIIPGSPTVWDWQSLRSPHGSLFSRTKSERASVSAKRRMGNYRQYDRLTPRLTIVFKDHRLNLLKLVLYRYFICPFWPQNHMIF